MTKKQKDTCAYKHNQCTCAQAVIPFPAGMGSRSNRMPSHPEIKQQNHCQAGDLPSLMRHHPEPHAATARTNRTTFISTQTLSTSIEGALYRVYAFVDSAAWIRHTVWLRETKLRNFMNIKWDNGFNRCAQKAPPDRHIGTSRMNTG